jgi:predicted RNA-binding Zn ribbon-like protein
MINRWLCYSALCTLSSQDGGLEWDPMSRSHAHLKTIKLVGGVLCLDFANTAELLNDYGDLLAWSERAGAIDESHVDCLRRSAETSPEPARKAFGRAASLLKAIRRIFSSLARDGTPAEKDLALLSTWVGRSAQHRQLQPSTEGFAWQWHNAEDHLDWPSWAIARSAADLLTSDQLGRVRECASRDCSWLFIDTSRNRSRRWCDMADCGNRAKARRNYERKRQGASRSQDGASANTLEV